MGFVEFGGSVYWVTFRIANDGHFAVYLNHLKAAIAGLADGKIWSEPASFFMFRSKAGLDSVAATLERAIREDRDFVLIGMPYQQKGRVVGNWDDDRLMQLMPYARFL